ncbi:MAG: hypothetical protein IT385_15660 [Deltaproteobacteria bacterium]|nr:hypothetical protein [Deltaproteobacteria bacterium]
MPLMNMFRRGSSSKSQPDASAPQQDAKAQLRGMSFDQQSAALTPQDRAPQTAPPIDEKHQRAEAIKGQIDKTTAIFDQERRDNDPYGESYVDKHNRHHRNKDLKAQITAQHQPQDKAKGYFERRKQTAEIRKRVEEEYEKAREVSPDRARRMQNADLKQAIQDDARAEADTLHPDDKKAAEAAYEKIWLRNYKLKRDYHGGESEKAKMTKSVEKEVMKEQNKKLLGELMTQAGKDPLRQENAKKIFEGMRAKTPEEEKEEAEKKEKANATAAEEQRKAKNAELKIQIAAKHPKSSAGKSAAQKEYLDQKTLSAKDQEKKQADQEKGDVKSHNALLKDGLKKGTLDPKQAALQLRFTNEKGRKAKNADLKKNMSRDEYRQNKVHRGQTDGFKANKDVKDVVSAVAPITQAAGIGNKAVAGGVKALGDQGAQSTVVGQSLTSGGGQKFKMGGTTTQAAGIIGAAGGVTNLVGGASDLYNAIGMRQDEDPANRERAKGAIVDSTVKMSTSTVSTAQGILQAIQGFASDPALAAAMQLEALPIVGIVGSTIKLIEAAATLAEAGRRAYKIVGMRADAKANKDDAMSAALKGLRHADLQLVTSSTIDVITAAASLAGHGLTLGGITGPAGVGLKAFASGLSLAKTAGMACYNSAQASKAKKAQVRFDQVKKRGGGDDEVMKAGKGLITTNHKYALQIVINNARDGDQTALDYMRLFGLDTKNFDQMSNENIRKHILGAIQQDEEPMTFLDKLKAIPSQARDAKRSVRKKIGAGY